MINKTITKYTAVGLMMLCLWACKIPALTNKTENKFVPAGYNNPQDSINSATLQWKEYFTDPHLIALIDTALLNNQELNIILQEIEIGKNEIQARKGEYLPFVGLKAGGGYQKDGRFTWREAVNDNLDIKRHKKAVEANSEFSVAAYATWELDIWEKLRNAKKAAVLRYLASIEGKHFAVTNLVAEVANSYYELLALDNQLQIVQQNINILNNALEIVKLQKEATRVTELAVRKFEAEVLKTKSLQYGIQQQIVETENRINFLLGRYPQPIARSSQSFSTLVPAAIQPGLPSQLLANRPDIKQAELELMAAKLDVQVAKAQFYPSLAISASFGYNAFNPVYLIRTPESLLYSLAGDLVAPLINKNAIKANYANANAKQIQVVYNYERSLIHAYIDVANQLSKINNLRNSYNQKEQQVQALTQSISIANDLFRSARADYMEVLLTQRDALEAKMELVETKQQQLNSFVDVYKALGGGWK